MLVKTTANQETVWWDVEFRVGVVGGWMDFFFPSFSQKANSEEKKTTKKTIILWCTVCYGVDWRKERRESERERWIPARFETPKLAVHDACLVKCAGCALSSYSEGTSVFTTLSFFLLPKGNFLWKNSLYFSEVFPNFIFIFFIQFSFPFTKVGYNFIWEILILIFEIYI